MDRLPEGHRYGHIMAQADRVAGGDRTRPASDLPARGCRQLVPYVALNLSSIVAASSPPPTSMKPSLA